VNLSLPGILGGRDGGILALTDGIADRTSNLRAS
jgi:hypothetical protein